MSTPVVTATAKAPAPVAAATAAQATKPVATNSDPSKAANAIRAVAAPFQIQTSRERQRWLKMLIYGAHGAGKTELACTAVDVPAMNDVLLISAEGGETTIDNSPRIKNPDKIHTIRVTTFKQIAYVQEFLTAYCKFRDAGDIAGMKRLFCQVTGRDPMTTADEDVPRYKTVIVDSLTEVEVYCTYGILGIDIAKVQADDIDTAGWPEFRKNLEMTKLLVRAFRDLPMHVIFTCAVQYTQDEHKRHHYTPQLTGKLSTQVQGFVDVVGYIVTGAPTEDGGDRPRRVYIDAINSGPKFDAKNRFPVYKQAYFDDPSTETMMRSFKLLT